MAKNNILKFLPHTLLKENRINSLRLYDFNDFKVKSGTIVYLIERELRTEDNFALSFALQKSLELNLPLKIICSKSIFPNKLKNQFISRQLTVLKENFDKLNINFSYFSGNLVELLNFLYEINTSILIIDFNPILNRNFLKNTRFKIFEIDGHNIVPARIVSEKQEYSAATFRRKIYNNISKFLTEFENELILENNEAQLLLKDFIETKLPDYYEFKNNPTKTVTSGLSKYLNLGFISSQRVALEVIKSNASLENKEAFLEELIVRKELADNFCLYCKNFKTFDCVSTWAKTTLNQHKNDYKPYIYSKNELEHAKTHDELWNATQIQLTTEGTIHGYLRMYWAKQLLKWTQNPQSALEIAIYLNDKYAFDSPSPSGYVGILWSLGALHDRAFQERMIIGKIREMTYNGAKSKFDVKKYIDKYIC